MPHGIYPPKLAESCKAHTGEKWRPSNGTEGEIFIASWCGKCGNDESTCEILTATFAYCEADSEYPLQWQLGADGQPKCTAFRYPGDAAPAERCGQTIDMFVEE